MSRSAGYSLVYLLLRKDAGLVMMLFPGKSLRPFHNYRLLGILVIIFLVGGLVLGAKYYLGVQLAPAAGNSGAERVVLVKIPEGASTRQIGEILQRSGLIKNSDFFVFYTRFTGTEKELQAGEYQLSNKMSLPEIIKVIASGKVVYHRVTIPEGYTVAQICELLARKGIVDKKRFQEVVASGDFSYPFLEGVPAGPKRLEGFLFPATYRFRAGSSEEEIVDMMLKRFAEAFTPELEKRAQELGFTVREVVTLASLVEREAKLDEERPLIAAVFLNRLHRGMRLESCATVLYALGEQKERLSYKDLQVDSPYNTYLHDGLPPGPIANPGLASIKAVLYPADVDYLYFVSRGDGSHYFSHTLEEHETAAKIYLK